MIERLGGEVDRELRRLGPGGVVGDVVRVWPDVVGEAIAQNAWPARLGRDGTLHVATTSAAWAFELTQLEASIAPRLADALAERAPKRLRFAPGLVPDRADVEEERISRARPLPAAVEQRRAAELTAEIEDEELRSLVARAAAASLAKARSGRLL